MSRVLLVDTNLAANPIYQCLVEQGHDIYVVGGNPGDFLAQSAVNYIQLDYADQVRLRGLIEELKIDYLVPGCNDFSYSVCAELNEQFDFPGIDSPANFHLLNNKHQFRQFALANGIPVPGLLTPEAVVGQLPVIVKPVDAYSGRGVTVVRESNNEALETAIALAKKASRSGHYLLEEYVEGTLFSHSAFLKDSKIVLDFFVEEHCIASPFAVDTSRVVEDFSSILMQQVRQAIESIAQHLQLVDGLFHTQFIFKEERFWIIEVTRRCPGDLYSLLIEYATGYRYAQMYGNPFLGHPQIRIGDPHRRFIVRHTMTVPNQTRFTGVSFSRPVTLAGYFPLARAGDLMAKAPTGRMGIFFTESDSEEAEQVIFNQLIRRVLYGIQ